MSALAISAVLTCKRGDLAGSVFELRAETMIGHDAAGRMVVASGTPLHTLEARIFVRDGVYHVESLGAPGRVALDGVAVRGTVALARLHVIELADATFMYSQRSSVAAATNTADGLGTMVDPGGFDPLPTLRAAARDDHGTVVDPGAFDAVPSLQPRIASSIRTPAAATPPADDGQTRVYQPPPKDPPFELVITLPGAGRTTFPLKYGDNIIGRGDGCDIRVQDPEKWLSRKHANLTVSDERVELIDLRGSNGTFVRGARVTTAVLVAGTRFTLGPQFEFSLEKR